MDAARCCRVYGLIGNSIGGLAEDFNLQKVLKQCTADCATYPRWRGRRAGGRALRGGSRAVPRQTSRAVASSRPLQSLPSRFRGLAVWQRAPPAQIESLGYGAKNCGRVRYTAVEQSHRMRRRATRGLPEDGSMVARQQVQEGCRALLHTCCSACAAVSHQRAAGALVAVCKASACRSYAVIGACGRKKRKKTERQRLPVLLCTFFPCITDALSARTA